MNYHRNFIFKYLTTAFFVGVFCESALMASSSIALEGPEAEKQRGQVGYPTFQTCLAPPEEASPIHAQDMLDHTLHAPLPASRAAYAHLLINHSLRETTPSPSIPSNCLLDASSSPLPAFRAVVVGNTQSVSGSFRPEEERAFTPSPVNSSSPVPLDSLQGLTPLNLGTENGENVSPNTDLIVPVHVFNALEEAHREKLIKTTVGAFVGALALGILGTMAFLEKK